MSNPTSTPMMRALAAGIRSGVPVLLWGEPGVGKTAKLAAHAREWGRHVETVVGSVRESSDYLGLPIETNGLVTYSPPAWAQRLAQTDAGLLFLDELTTAAPSVQKAMLRILQERYVGELGLPESVSIVAAANPPETAADGWDLPAPVANRLLHLDWHFDRDEWLDGVGTGFTHTRADPVERMLGPGSDADRARVAGMVTAFLRHRPELLAPAVPIDPVQAGKAWPSPRTWTNAIDVLAELEPSDEDAALLVVQGCVGEAAATELVAWMSLADLHDPDEVLAEPTIVAWESERPDRLFALTSAVTSLAQARGGTKPWQQALAVLTACAEGDKPDVALPSVRVLLNNMPDNAGVPEATRTVFCDLFQRTGRWTASTEAEAA